MWRMSHRGSRSVPRPYWSVTFSRSAAGAYGPSRWSTGAGRPIAPCGRCRQVLYEHGGPDLLVAGPDGPWTMATLLPHPFGPDDLARRGRPVTTGPERLPGPPAGLPEGHRALGAGETGEPGDGDRGRSDDAGPVRGARRARPPRTRWRPWPPRPTARR